MARLSSALRRGLGDANVVPHEPTSSSEDFGVYGRVAGVPGVQVRVGAIPPDELATAAKDGRFVPGPHNSRFAPDREPTIRTGLSTLTLSVLELLGNGVRS